MFNKKVSACTASSSQLTVATLTALHPKALSCVKCRRNVVKEGERGDSGGGGEIPPIRLRDVHQMFLDGHKFLSRQALGPGLDHSLMGRLVLVQLHLAVLLHSVGLAGGVQF